MYLLTLDYSFTQLFKVSLNRISSWFTTVTFFIEFKYFVGDI